MALRVSLLLLLSIVLSGCGLWESEEKIEPAELVDFQAEQTVSKKWSRSLGSGLGEKYDRIELKVLGDRLFAADVSGNVFALELETGKTIWHQDLDTALTGGVGIGDGKVLVTSVDGRLYSFKALDGEPVWDVALSSESVSAPQANADVVVVQTIDGRITAFDSATADTRWTYNAQQPALTLRGTSTPLLIDGVVFTAFASGKVTAIRAADGISGWETRVALSEGKTELERMIDIDGQMLLDDRVLYVTSYQGQLAAIRSNDGAVLWKRALSSTQGVAKIDSQLIAADAEGKVTSYEISNGLEYWAQDALYYRRLTAPVTVDGFIAVADFEGYVHILSPQDGRFLARYRVDSSGVRGPMLSHDGVLYVYGNGGRLAALTIQ